MYLPTTFMLGGEKILSALPRNQLGEALPPELTAGKASLNALQGRTL
ncbi:MAG: hypothetical protein QNJ51_08050 [Calothrix sp. MO_167.B12]|nr:hypothetical protein [Calothrix sp. MO_167.B12]